MTEERYEPRLCEHYHRFSKEWYARQLRLCKSIELIKFGYCDYGYEKMMVKPEYRCRRPDTCEILKSWEMVKYN